MDSAEDYEQFANEFLQLRDDSLIGRKEVRSWVQKLPKAADVLEIACGGGYPISRELLQAGVKLSAIDSSPTLLKTFAERFPQVSIKCEKIQDSDLFDRQFDAVICIGMVFLLSEDEQRSFIAKVAKVVKPNGQFLFTAPKEVGCWRDILTRTKSFTLGYDDYVSCLEASGFRLLDTFVDAGQNNYYLAQRL